MTAEAAPRRRQNIVAKKTKSLALEWLRDEISTAEAQQQLGCGSVNHAIYSMAIALRQAYREELFTVSASK